MAASAIELRLEETFDYLCEEIEARSNFSESFRPEAFLDYFIEMAGETGDAPELTKLSAVNFGGSKPFSVDAFFYDETNQELTF